MKQLPISQCSGGTYGGQGMYDDDIAHDQVKEAISAQENESIVKSKMNNDENN